MSSSDPGTRPAHGARTRSPWVWIPSLYLAEGLPYAVVMTVSVILYKSFGVSNTEIALITSWLYLPWVIKPLWSPVVDILGTRRLWIWTMQLLIAVGLAGVAFSLGLPNFVTWTLVCFWLLAIASATHDIAADGFYMLATNERQQSMFVGVRTMFYRVAMIVAGGPLVILAGELTTRSGDPRHAWSVAMGLLAALFVLFGVWHRFQLPRAAADRPGEARQIGQFVREFLATFGTFFKRPGIVPILLFLLLYRFGEAQLVKMAAPFLLDGRAEGGLGLTTSQVGFIYGTIGVIALTLGGILGGWMISRHGLGRWLWIMLLAIHLPDAVFVWLAYVQPTSLPLVQIGIAIEQFGYGFGFTAYVVYLLSLARGKHQTAHYAIGTGLMALGMMVPGMWSGWLADHIGYRSFFVWVLVATVPSFVVARFIPIDRDFGRKEA